MDVKKGDANMRATEVLDTIATMVRDYKDGKKGAPSTSAGDTTVGTGTTQATGQSAATGSAASTHGTEELR